MTQSSQSDIEADAQGEVTQAIAQELRHLFTQSNEFLHGEQFEQRLVLKMRQQRRVRVVGYMVFVSVLVGIAVVVAPHAINGSIAMGDLISDASLNFGQLLVSPAGWIGSLLVAVCVLQRARA